MSQPNIVYCDGFIYYLGTDPKLRDTVHNLTTLFRRSFLARRMADHSSRKFQFVNRGFLPKVDQAATVFGFIMYFHAPAVNDGVKVFSFTNAAIEFCKFYDLYLYFFDGKYRSPDFSLMLDDPGATALSELSKQKR